MTAISTNWVLNGYTWPYDMLRLLNYYSLILHYETGSVDLYEAYCGTDDVWVATKILDNLLTHSPGNTYAVGFDIADFDWFYAFTMPYMSGGSLATKCYIRQPVMASSTTVLKALPDDSCPQFLSCCNFKGQPILGGIISTDQTWTQLGKCSVAWGAIGQWEFRPSVNRTAGFIRMPWADWDQGIVLKVARLGNRLVVLGNGGRAVLEPYAKEHITGFGIEEYTGCGISSGFHWAGDYRIHCFLGTDFNLYTIKEGSDWGKNVTFNKHGYKEYMQELQEMQDDVAPGSPIVISFDHVRRRFFICGVEKSYVLTEHGLYSCHQSTTGVGRYRGKTLTGFVKDLGDVEGRFVSGSIDLRNRGLKTLETLEFGLSAGSNAYAGINYSYDYSTLNKYRESGWTKLGKEGVMFPMITAIDHRIKFKVEDYRDGVVVDYVTARWKQSDKRFIRGMYNANKAQS